MSLHLLPNGVTLTPGVKPLLAETAAWYLLLLSGPTVQVTSSLSTPDNLMQVGSVLFRTMPLLATSTLVL